MNLKQSTIKRIASNAKQKLHNAVHGNPSKKAEMRFENLQGAIHNETIQNEEEMVKEMWSILGLAYQAQEQGTDMQHLASSIKELIYNECEDGEMVHFQLAYQMRENGAEPEKIGFSYN